MLKTIKRFLIESALLFARIIFFWIPGDYYKGYALLAFHLIFGLGSYLAFFHSSKTNRLIIAFVFFLILVQQLLLRTCVLTKAENLLHKDNITIVDPFLIVGGIEKTKDTRYASSLSFVSCLGGTILFCILTQDLKWEPENVPETVIS